MNKQQAAHIILKTGYKYSHLKSYGNLPSRKEEQLLTEFGEQSMLRFHIWNKASFQLQSYQKDQRWILNLVKIIPIFDSTKKESFIEEYSYIDNL